MIIKGILDFLDYKLLGFVVHQTREISLKSHLRINPDEIMNKYNHLPNEYPIDQLILAF
jgi:hypothetical protein